jgi:hypothetical protein
MCSRDLVASNVRAYKAYKSYSTQYRARLVAKMSPMEFAGQPPAERVALAGDGGNVGRRTGKTRILRRVQV